MALTEAARSRLISELNGLGSVVGFSPVQSPEQSPGTEKARLLGIARSPYAILALWEVVEPSSDFLGSAIEQGSLDLDRRLEEEESNGRLLDGYLLLALDSDPSGELERSVRDAEIDPRVCRKHVLWSVGEDSTWQERLSRVTVLPLPEGARALPIAEPPVLPAKSRLALELYQGNERIAPLVRDVEQRVEAEIATAANEANED